MEEVYKCYCDKCHKTVYVNEDSLYPGIAYNKKCEEYLIFKVKCPICLSLNNIDIEDIQYSVKLKKMKEYAGFINKMQQILIIDYMIKTLEEEKSELLDEINEIKKCRDINHLYKNWLDNEFVLNNPDNPSGNKKKKYCLK